MPSDGGGEGGVQMERSRVGGKSYLFLIKVQLPTDCGWLCSIYGVCSQIVHDDARPENQKNAASLSSPLELDNFVPQSSAKIPRKTIDQGVYEFINTV